MDGVPGGHTTAFQQGVTCCVKDFRRGKVSVFAGICREDLLQNELGPADSKRAADAAIRQISS
jgi:hypothetical protein